MSLISCEWVKARVSRLRWRRASSEGRPGYNRRASANEPSLRCLDLIGPNVPVQE